MKRFFFLFFASFSFILSGVLFTSSSASAVSPYDDIIINDYYPMTLQTVKPNNASVSRTWNNNSDFFNWVNHAATRTSDCSLNNLNNALDKVFSGNPYFIQSSGSQATIYISDVKDRPVSFEQIKPPFPPNAQPKPTLVMGKWIAITVAYIYQYDSNSPIIDRFAISQCYGSAVVNKSYTASNPLRLVSQRGIDFNLPQNYDGYVPKNGDRPINNPVGYTSYVPKFVVHDNFDTSKPFRVEISDSNFLTIDKIAFTCEGGLAPVLYYEIWDRLNVDIIGDEVLLYQGYLNATAPIIRDLPVASSQKYYRVIGWYDCGSGAFPNSNFLDFSLNPQGTLNNTSEFDLCMKPDFPFMDLKACVDNFETIVNMLAFGQLKLGNTWIFETGQCRSINFIGGWLHLNNKYICPIFPNYVRDTVTPFVTFLLGLLSLQFISRLRREGN